VAKFRRTKFYNAKITKTVGGRGRNGKAGIGGSGVRRIGGKAYKRTSWHGRKIPIPNPKTAKEYQRRRPNYDAKTKTYTGLTASEMAKRRGGKVIRERSWFKWSGGEWGSDPVWSVYEEEK
tara:strand:- start:51 stop:413 length:363 start_codon:yes stop_codon:yes gene_type:complete